MTPEMKIELREKLTEDITADELRELIVHYQDRVDWENQEESGYAAG